uniref:Homeobox protein cut-like n=1 Tax=Heterorhabditis bacteriophora TaxID=37862 RepID=A0A1I7XT53_HETBA
MALTKDIALPSEKELSVPQEITLSTPWLKSVAPYMAKHCEREINEFMLRRKELEDPRATLKEGAAVTACGIKFLQSLKRTCPHETDVLANCIDQGSSKLYISKCRDEQKSLDTCIEEKLGVSRPKMGYFSKLHVHESEHPVPQPYVRDYKAEARKIRIEGEVKAIGARQDAEEAGRALLLEECSKYRQNSDKETRKVAVPLIKAFQREVDELTVRGKATEAALIEIYSQLVNIPDPTPVLEQAAAWKLQADKAHSATEEVDQLRENISQLHVEFADLKNQDVTIRHLRERIKQLEADYSAKLEQSIEETKKTLKEEFAIRDNETNMRTDKLRAENGLLEKKFIDFYVQIQVGELEARMRDAQRHLDNARQAADQRETFESEQIEILVRDLDDANRRVASFELEIARLTSELAEAKASSKRGNLEDIAALGGLMKEKDEQVIDRKINNNNFLHSCFIQIAILNERNRRLSETVEEETRRARERCDELTAELERHSVLVSQMEAQLADQSDYDAIRKELRLLREIEFGDVATANEESINRLGETVQSLDRLLAEKNRRLQNENAQLRLSNEQYQGDEVMQAILAGSHQMVVDTVSKNVGRELAENYLDHDVDWALDKQVRRATKTATQESERKASDAADQQNLFKILLNMGSPMSTTNVSNDNDPSPSSDIPFEQFRYSPKLTNYTGEPAKTPQEVKAIQDLQVVKVNCFASAWNSQGSLSELLSKPRHWSKLTDKGREAFRRIYGWISDEKAIDLLCSLSPRRVWPSEVRIEHPTPESLWESNSGSLPPDEPDENTYKRATSAREDQSVYSQLDEISPAYHEMSHSERMASISHAHQVMSARMRSGLAPITQDQFEMFGHIDTEDVVRQGSVSDLLARPKQWNMLTQKGREPFIRMKLFMREVAQSAERARRDREKRSKSATEIVTEEEECQKEVPPVKVKYEIVEDDDIIALPRSEFDQQMNSHSGCNSGEEGEREMDTSLVVRKVKDRLHMHGISQRLFGEVVLGISAGGCSELFLRPRRWSSLSVRGREPFEKMRAWLADKESVHRLLARERVECGLPSEKSVLNGNGKRLSDPPYEPPPRKVQRTIITDQQKEALRFVFQHEHHPSQKTVELLSMKLNLNIRTVNNWFHNHRTRQKASMKEGKDYPPALPSVPRSKNWQQDLAAMLDSVAQASLLDDPLPTMMPVLAPSLFSNDDRIEKTSSQLDRAVAKMHLLAASKSS